MGQSIYSFDGRQRIARAGIDFGAADFESGGNIPGRQIPAVLLAELGNLLKSISVLVGLDVDACETGLDVFGKLGF